MRQYQLFKVAHKTLPLSLLFHGIRAVGTDGHLRQSPRNLRIIHQITVLQVGTDQDQGRTRNLTKFGVDALDVVENIAATFPVGLE